MNNYLEYKGYIGSVEISKEDKCFYGSVQHIKGLLSYEGTTYDELVDDFKGLIDEYLADCKAQGLEPQKPYKGSFNVRINPKTHRQLAINAKDRGLTLNSYVADILEHAL